MVRSPSKQKPQMHLGMKSSILNLNPCVLSLVNPHCILALALNKFLSKWIQGAKASAEIFLLNLHGGLNGGPAKDTATSKSLEHVNVTVFEKRVFAGIIKLRVFR